MLEVTPIPVLSDNYTWLLRAPQGDTAVVVDPGEAAPVAKALEAMGVKLAAIMITHHHTDHVAGIEGLIGNGLPVYGPADSPIPFISDPVKPGETLTPPGLGPTFDVLGVPGHTLDHLAFFGDGLLFAGDALFAGGCGRMFEGTPAQMQGYLSELRKLPGETRLYCGHEYTLANLTFALAVEPDNVALQARHAQIEQQHARGAITLPSTLAEECATNPFLRWDVEAVIQSAEAQAGHALSDPIDVFAALRAWKDRF
ncbi:MAG: hydroxyacylglutathione hydrolase [Spiribacter sp.]|nr:hydroxyacylglutathione hydrolase [Spiribacter sp.]MDR9454810.1 hydroxyacylglutathione hydrolase [Spiribacter sp.]